MPPSAHRLAWWIRTDIKELWTFAEVGASGKNSTARVLEKIEGSLLLSKLGTDNQCSS
jgi:hypothetical protein